MCASLYMYVCFTVHIYAFHCAAGTAQFYFTSPRRTLSPQAGQSCITISKTMTAAILAEDTD